MEKYFDYCINKGESYYDYNNFAVNWNETDNYEIIKFIGKGKYSNVFLGKNIVNDENIVLKILKPVRYEKFLREIKILELVKDGPNIIKLLDNCKNPYNENYSLIFEYLEGNTLKHYKNDLSDLEIRFYFYKLLEGLDYCHSIGIIHRDVKSINIIIDRKNKILKIIDWGLSDFYVKGNNLNVRVSSKPYKSPELLVNYEYYHFSMDIWSVGCILGSIIFKKDYLFLGDDNFNQLKKIIQTLGTKDFYDFLKKYDIEFEAENIKSIGKHKKIPFSSMVNNQNKDLANEDAIDLLNKMLIYDFNNRITAKEALKHKYFDPIRNLL